MRKFVIVGVVLLLGAGGGSFGYYWYTTSQALSSLVYEQEHIESYLQSNAEYAPVPGLDWTEFNTAISNRDVAGASAVLQEVYQQDVLPTDSAMNAAYNELNEEYRAMSGDADAELVHTPICPMSYRYFQDTDLLTGCFPMSQELLEQAAAGL